MRNILKVELGKHEMDTWYFSPFPPEYTTCKKLYFCEFTLNFFKRKEQLQRHLRKNEMYHPPGDEIYRNESRGKTTAFFEIDGKKEKMFCQNLCYLAKLFSGSQGAAPPPRVSPPICQVANPARLNIHCATASFRLFVSYPSRASLFRLPSDDARSHRHFPSKDAVLRRGFVFVLRPVRG